ncbi:hypothetical protein PM082_023368 [Marasmius tenuissimus]|nr:hypothetical protein PM082_023368 [Marasmius tenuissimus]
MTLRETSLDVSKRFELPSGIIVHLSSHDFRLALECRVVRFTPSSVSQPSQLLLGGSLWIAPFSYRLCCNAIWNMPYPQIVSPMMVTDTTTSHFTATTIDPSSPGQPHHNDQRKAIPSGYAHLVVHLLHYLGVHIHSLRAQSASDKTLSTSGYAIRPVRSGSSCDQNSEIETRTQPGKIQVYILKAPCITHLVNSKMNINMQCQKQIQTIIIDKAVVETNRYERKTCTPSVRTHVHHVPRCIALWCYICKPSFFVYDNGCWSVFFDCSLKRNQSVMSLHLQLLMVWAQECTSIDLW